MDKRMDSFDKKVGIGIVAIIMALIGLYVLFSRPNPDDEIVIVDPTPPNIIDQDEKATQEIRQKKANGELCLSSADAWSYAGSGKNYCVVFHPEYFYHTGYGMMFINEKKDYKKGFVAPLMKYYMISWEDLLANYRVDKIAVTGELVWYEGHPEIKVYDLSQITIPKVYNCETSEGCVYTRN
ncbi:hypothetical protein IKG73_02010 [Candidatus Saccharibacteria bacterium]|nr:hypothetical protein [Candidatus Saccharibacteria bacterium]